MSRALSAVCSLALLAEPGSKGEGAGGLLVLVFSGACGLAALVCGALAFGSREDAA